MARTREPDHRRALVEGPVRTCVGCRSRGTVSELLRVVAEDGVLVPDPRRRRPGRGAWVHPSTACLHSAVRRSAFPRALRVPGPVDTDPVRVLLEGSAPPEPEPRDASTVASEPRKQVDPR